MPDIQPGDIVTIGTRESYGFWTVLHFAGFGQWRCRYHYGARGAGAVDFTSADLSLLLRPALNIGDTLKLNGKTVTVIEFFGDTVKVEIAAEDRREPLPWGGHVAFGVGQAVIGRGELVSENVSQLLRDQAGG